MAILSTAQRARLKPSQFALPGGRYPVPDRAHAANAKARAKQQLQRGNLSRLQYDLVVKRANAKLRG